MDRRFTKDHEWIVIENNIGTIGISDYAQKQLGDVVYVSLISAVGESVTKGAAVAEIESVKSVSQIFSPASGEICEFNIAFENESNSIIINEDPYGKGWILKIKIADTAEPENLMDDKQYDDYLKKL
jgi:glycine cleavage system H protein